VKKLKTFDIFVNEKYKDPNYNPLEGDCGVTINDKDFTFSVKKLVEYVKKNYKSEHININDVKKIGLFKDLIKSKPNKGGKFFFNNKWKKSEDLTDEEWEKFKEEQRDIFINSNLKYPIIVVYDKNKITNILDGNHRIEKATYLNKKTIKAYKIPSSDIPKIEKKIK